MTLTISIRARHLELPSVHHDAIARRLDFALARLSTSIRDVDCVVTDINGPRGGLDKHVRLRVRGHAGSMILIDDLGDDLMTTIGRAADRLQRAAIRVFARRRRFAPDPLA